MGVRTYIAEPDRGTRNWDGKKAGKTAVYANRRRIQGERGKRLQRQHGERIERNLLISSIPAGPCATYRKLSQPLTHSVENHSHKMIEVG